MSEAGSVNLEGIVKRHGAVTVLHGVDLAIAPGEFFALLGGSLASATSRWCSRATRCIRT
jgi:ABC-type sugar transport system ATPase subunit